MPKIGNIFHRKNDSKSNIDNNNSGGLGSENVESDDNNNEGDDKWIDNNNNDDDSLVVNNVNSSSILNGQMVGAIIYFTVHLVLMIITFVVLSIWLSYEVSECPVQ